MHKSTTITVRTDAPLRRRLARRAAESGMTLSELVREILANAVAERPLGRRAGHLKGRLGKSEGAADPWESSLRERNWRP